MSDQKSLLFLGSVFLLLGLILSPGAVVAMFLGTIAGCVTTTITIIFLLIKFLRQPHLSCEASGSSTVALLMGLMFVGVGGIVRFPHLIGLGFPPPYPYGAPVMTTVNWFALTLFLMGSGVFVIGVAMYLNDPKPKTDPNE